jgi:hypothetical protein
MGKGSLRQLVQLKTKHSSKLAGKIVEPKSSSTWLIRAKIVTNPRQFKSAKVNVQKFVLLRHCQELVIARN